MMEWSDVPVFTELSDITPKSNVIYCFINSVGNGHVGTEAIAQDGKHLGGHVSSSETFAKIDIRNPYKCENVYAKHYPGGYVMVWIDIEDYKQHADDPKYDLFNLALHNNKIRHQDSDTIE